MIGNVQVEIVPKGPDGVTINNIRTAIDRGQGQASAALKELTDMADEMGVTLNLFATSYSENGSLSTDDLIEWYARHGFSVTKQEKRGSDMVRQPQGTKLSELLEFSHHEDPEWEVGDVVVLPNFIRSYGTLIAPANKPHRWWVDVTKIELKNVESLSPFQGQPIAAGSFAWEQDASVSDDFKISKTGPRRKVEIIKLWRRNENGEHWWVKRTDREELHDGWFSRTTSGFDPLFGV